MLLEWQRLATSLATPLPAGLVLLVVAAVLYRLRWRRVAAVVFAVAFTGLWLAATPWFSSGLIASLEAPYPPLAANSCNKAAAPRSAIVVLGGGIRPLHDGDIQPRLYAAADRVWHAARLYHAGCASRVLLSGGGGADVPFAYSEAAAMMDMLASMAVPHRAMLAEPASRNTLQNAQYSLPLLQAEGIDRILLVTSAWHMRRALAIFAAHDMHVEPAAADYRSLASCPATRLVCWVPGGEALWHTELAIKEYLGFWVQVVLWGNEG